MSDQVPNFTTKEFVKALKYLNFTIDNTKGIGKHKKAKDPRNIKILPGQRDFVMIPNDKNPGPVLKARLIKELKMLGFTKEQLIRALRQS